MNSNVQANPAFTISKVLGRVSLVSGIIIIFFDLISISGFDPESPHSISGPLYFFIFALALIYYYTKSRKRRKNYILYSPIIASNRETSINYLAASTSKSVEAVTKDLEDLIKDMFYTGCYIDNESCKLIFENEKEEHSSKDDSNAKNKNTNKAKSKEAAPKIIAVTCKNCGASNKVQKGKKSVCEYCGTELNS